ncbi:amino acid adenylation domain-containing protein [Streptomyces piniterrae]|uniref:Amino acid adenylation domain-containing protein n=1 Tax=Streptomyces piniterrae TaxID=2571125 RepID=A0A4U0MT25_9ACTN|nr:non-ribosomal peptide synthetase [Streptomyces piniterrae]TJZ44121.1 amino acid adenylation domain-containing protein [Streptomyces piniterrae]
MSQQPRDLNSMSPEEKRELLAQLLEDSPKDGAPTILLEQRRLWMLLQLAETQPWQVLAALHIRGRLDLAALQLALTELVQRHEVLRMSFLDVGGQPVGSTAPSLTLSMPVVDVGGADPDAEIARLVKREARTPFDIAKGPLVRTSVARRGEDDHVLLITMHQLVADRRSLGLFVDDLSAVYSALVEDREAELPPVAAEFAELVAAQRQWLAGDEAAKDAAYWRERMADLAPLELLTDRPRPPLKTIAGASVGIDLGPAAVAGLTGYADRTGQELSSVLLAGYAAVLGRYAQTADLAVGVPVPALPYPQAERLIGPLQNTLPLRFDLSEDPTLDELVTQTAAARAQALAHGRLPFDRVVEEVQPQRDLRHSPLFQTFFSFEEEPESRELPGARLGALRLDTGWTPHDIDLFAIRSGAGLRLQAHYNTDLFDADTVHGLLGHLALLLSLATAEPSRPLSALPVLTDAERHQVVTEWNATAQPYPRERCLHELVEARAADVPDGTAVVAGDQKLTYRQLNDRANAVAAELIARGTAPETRVGVAVPRTADSVVGLLGVLKSGGAYVPIDPAYPADRLNHILADAGIDVLVGSRAALDSLPALDRTVATVATPDTDPAVPAANPATGVGPRHLAYQIYTSGSTGRPKGVAVEHRQIVASTSARTVMEAAGQPERYLVLAPLTFDASAGGLYWTLTRGGTVVFPDDSELYDPRLLGKLIRTHEITHVDGVPSQYSILLETDLSPHDSVRACVLAGEALPPSLVAEHYRRSPDAALFNEYGPTEATVWATAHTCRPEHADLPRVPIGRPVPNARVHLLDEHLNPVPPGLTGELYIAGDGVTRGYPALPGDTAERFLPDPFSARPGDRIYRTGDRARHLRDGSIEFLGRADDQVKIRGFRVELAEIENVLLRHPLVTEAVVRLREDQPGLQRLIAYVVPVGGRVLTQEALSAHAVAELPDYMVPSQFISLDRMPLTRHGKIDTAALPSPEENVVGGYIEPRTQLEADIAETLGDVLGLQRVSATASFFALGGNSLLVARLTARLSREHDVDLPIDEIFRVPTVEGIARTIETHQRKQGQVDSEVLYAQQVAELLADVKLDPGIRPDGLPHADYLEPRNVLVTGATGYLGAFLVVELMHRTDATVHCLIRAESTEAAQERLEQVLRTYRAWDDSYRDRLRAVVGDLGKPSLDLSRETFDELAGTIDSIYHSAAIVNFTFPYEAMKPANVHGTEELLRLATRTRVKAFHFVSSVDVFMGTGAERPFTEVDLPEKPQRIPTGYPRTKWVAEKLVALARDRGLPVTIQRPWMITGHTRTGASHHTDYLYVYLKGFLDLGVLPLFNDVINAVPVDYTAEAIVYTSLRKENFGKNFNITNPEPTTMSQCYEWLRSYGYTLNVIDEEEARQRALDVEQDHILYPMTPMLRVASMRHAALDPELQKRVNPADECCVLTEALEGSGIECPPVDEAWAHSCFRYLIETGFLPAPDAEPAAADG